MDYRAYWKGETTQELHLNMPGYAFKASGHDDPESAEHLGWLFQPVGQENAYYCEWKDIELIEEQDSSNGYPTGTIGAETR